MFTAAALVTVLGLALMMQAGGPVDVPGGLRGRGAAGRFRRSATSWKLPSRPSRACCSASSSWRWDVHQPQPAGEVPGQILGLTLGRGGHQFVTLYALRRLIGGRKADAQWLAGSGPGRRIRLRAVRRGPVLPGARRRAGRQADPGGGAVDGPVAPAADARRPPGSRPRPRPRRSGTSTPCRTGGAAVIAGFGGWADRRPLLLARGVPFTALDADPGRWTTVRKFGLPVLRRRRQPGPAACGATGEAKVLRAGDRRRGGVLRTAELVRRHFPMCRSSPGRATASMPAA